MTQATQTGTSVDPRVLRRALGNFATGVTIVTATSPAGERTGVTANSFNSVSLDPPLVLWSLDKRSGSCAVFEQASHFAVNILASDQIPLSNQFARPNTDKFAGVALREGHGGSLLLEGCAASFQCEKHQVVDAGDHWILIGRVLEFEDGGQAPLLYHQGAYSMVLPHPHGARGENAAPQLPSGYQSRLRDNYYYLMTQAVRRYQEDYQPEQLKTGWRAGEARLLMVLDPAQPLSLGALVREADMPAREIDGALALLRERGLVQDAADGVLLTEAGAAEAKAVWEVAQAQQERVFGRFSPAQMHAFRTVLAAVIDSQPQS
ncbi:p-hydroxyphenylacetate 3-hydroxylase reductase component [Kerstersia similis]|uniref:p-hydroxyphenylacetate 3-hydroxylase reductase component n=1 Tax=Kerstersia similis TaxID=206505 RepID=UPI0039EFB282